MEIKKIIPDPTYGGIFYLHSKGNEEFIKKMIKRGCPPAGIMLAYILEDEYDRASGVEIVQIKEKLENHFKRCKSCQRFLSLMAEVFLSGKA